LFYGLYILAKFGSFCKVLVHQLTYALFQLTDDGFGLMGVTGEG